jgi:curved DNA-binding protein CbpA
MFKFFIKYSSKFSFPYFTSKFRYSSSSNPFHVLQIPPSSSQKEIRMAYLRLAKLYHPDKNPENLEKFKSIQQAYEALKNENHQEFKENGEKSEEAEKSGEGVFDKERRRAGMGEGGVDEVEQMRMNFKRYADERNYFRR